ncbi:hypothetical protein PYCCODRAFT_1224856 [Trametes coccinea BRFM310]|uniref:Uncharacterized protein n=1 Tax=Trametes coccinea (strain BRFM310) TaxID=1353009 RepID=A0A1Y2IW36_TRAC3|nr:hypothetical protein PYCCODRAFT_1224856 [Trametes coccinea BRFM310]
MRDLVGVTLCSCDLKCSTGIAFATVYVYRESSVATTSATDATRPRSSLMSTTKGFFTALQVPARDRSAPARPWSEQCLSRPAKSPKLRRPGAVDRFSRPVAGPPCARIYYSSGTVTHARTHARTAWLAATTENNARRAVWVTHRDPYPEIRRPWRTTPARPHTFHSPWRLANDVDVSDYDLSPLPVNHTGRAEAAVPARAHTARLR